MKRRDLLKLTGAALVAAVLPPVLAAQAPSLCFDDTSQAWTKRFEQQTYSIVLHVTREVMEDDLYGVLTAHAKETTRLWNERLVEALC